MDKLATFEFGSFYHVFNRTNNRERLFKNDQNRRYFLRQYKKFVAPYVNTHSYCLLPNHFHFSIAIKSKDILTRLITERHQGARSKMQSKFLKT
ncbi:MAG: hypothetical protein HKN76_16475 [Saprospiraceae bacterium]|nr:hypothetical protein [Saprospiraceae bacterium]